MPGRAPGASRLAPQLSLVVAALLMMVPTASVAPAVPVQAPTTVGGEPIRLGRTQPDGRIRIETVSLDDYVAQVLAGEGQPTAGDAAQQALAITARTFAAANRNRHRRDGFDLCDTTHCQVVRPATAVTRRAAVATANQVLLQAGRPAPVFYSASCGGRLERASQVWPGAVDLSQPDRDDAHAGDPPWSSEVRVTDIERALRAGGLRGGRLRSLRVIQRNQSGRVVRLRAEGFAPPEISGNDFRLAIGRVGGWQLVKSTAFDVQRTGRGYLFRGRGFGHGVGLCVVGAGARALRGETSDAILRFYFPALTVGRVPTGALQATATDTAAPGNAAGAAVVPAAEGAAVPPVAPAAPAAATPSALIAPAAPASAAPVALVPRDVQLALPAGEEDARVALLALVRRARDDAAAATGQKAPPILRLTVHPTVESFGRATGQPWWVSGATSGVDIALLPVTILQQRGQLERAVRHEVAHALIDATLADRSTWVREGAAIYFAGAADKPNTATHAASARITCPTDAELLRPVSAGAQRDAYARAEACFARQISSGKKWTDVR
jgi:SpoIID/LytB domain protein